MKILGVHPGGGFLGSHDTSAAIVIDGKLIAACEEERFTRKKHEDAFPINAMNFCLEYAGLTLNDIDFIAVPWFGINTYSSYLDLIYTIWKLKRGRRILLRKVANSIAGPRMKKSRSFSYRDAGDCFYGDLTYLSNNFDEFPVVKYIEHHRAHATCAFYSSGFNEAAVVSIDGGGYFYSTVVWKGANGNLKKTRGEPVINTTGVYRDFTEFLNLGHFGEGKTMGLSGYGKLNSNMTQRIKKYILDADEGIWFKDRLYYSHIRKHRAVSETGIDILPRKDEYILQEKYTDLTYAMQKELEKAYLNVSTYAVNITKSRNICFAGGVALNCLANSHVLKSGLIDNIFVFPASYDGGTSIGAALELARRLGDKVSFKMEHAYWGPEYYNKEIEKFLKENKIPFSFENDIAGKIAKLLSEGKVVGWFQGRMEIGPRALGNRSILADPRKKDMWEKINRIKGREYWRPLAPSILEEHKHEYFEDAVSSPFMLLSFKVKNDKIDKIPAVVHVDGSTRPQTVDKKINPLFWDLIKNFQKLSDIPLILNTSFNLEGQPIVCTPKDAIDCFYNSGLDNVAIGNFLLGK